MKPNVGAWMRYELLRAADLLSRRGRGPQTELALPVDATRESLWLFVSTIGELNAIAPLLDALATTTTHLQWVILSDRRIYAEAYRQRHPKAEVVEIGDHPAEAARLAKLRPPAMFLIAEIPLQPNDAPCRLPYAWLYEAARHGASVVSVNGWLYGYESACRIDSVERQLVAADWLALHDAICVQSPQLRDTLIALGAPAARITVTGNIKFDALDRQTWSIAATRSPKLLASLIDRDRPTVVAGCVTDEDEQTLVLDAFLGLRRHDPGALLVIAPRHPEQAPVMRLLNNALEARALRTVLLSQHGDRALAPDIDVLTLDTMGELRDFYASASVAHVGRDHNVLEPLAFGTPVSVRPGWVSTYPSFPVFQLLAEEGELQVHDHADELANAWHHSTVHSSREERSARVKHLVTHFGGATQRTMQAITPFLLADHNRMSGPST